MSKKYKEQQIYPDVIYNDITVSKFINHIMKKGKKTLASKIVYSAFDIIKKQTKQEDVLEVFKKALNNVGPSVEVKPQRVGGATYQVPKEVKGKRKISLAMRWIIDTAQKKKGRSMKEKLAQELILASNNEGDAVKKRINVQKMAVANRAFAYLTR